MNRRSFLAKSATLPLAARAAMLEAQTTPSRAQDKARGTRQGSGYGDPGKPNLDRYHLTLDRVLRGKNPEYTPEFLAADLRGEPGRRFTEFSGDLSGRWIGALAASSSSFGEDFPALDAFVKKALPLQHSEGYFGKSFNSANPGDNDLALLWGNGRLLVGLMEYYSLRRDPATLAAARKLGDFLVGLGPQFNSQKMADDFGAGHFATSYICWTQQTEGLAALYAETKEAKYRDLCADISSRMERRPGDHVHGYLCSVRGTLALYEATKDQAFLDRTVAAWNDINNSGDILITGGVPEAWSPKKKRTEGCAECDWLRLNLALYRVAGEEKYLATAESLIFNEFAMNQFATGDFGHAVLYEDFSPETVEVRAWWCCTLHGLRAFADVNDSVFRQQDNDIVLNLALDGRFKSRHATLESKSHLAAEGRIRISVQNAGGGNSLVVRKPAWADAVVLTRNGAPIDGLRVANIATGDDIVAQYTMNLRVVSADRVQSNPEHSAVYVGPWLVGASSHDQPDYFNELYPENEIVLDNRRAPYTAKGLRFAVPVAARTCDCIAAEFPGQPMNVQLRAVAEQTQYEPARWQTAFKVRQNT